MQLSYFSFVALFLHFRPTVWALFDTKRVLESKYYVDYSNHFKIEGAICFRMETLILRTEIGTTNSFALNPIDEEKFLQLLNEEYAQKKQSTFQVGNEIIKQCSAVDLFQIYEYEIPDESGELSYLDVKVLAIRANFLENFPQSCHDFPNFIALTKEFPIDITIYSTEILDSEHYKFQSRLCYPLEKFYTFHIGNETFVEFRRKMMPTMGNEIFPNYWSLFWWICVFLSLLFGFLIG